MDALITPHRRRRQTGWTILLLGVCVFGAYNLNGREIPNYDSQPTKFTARELSLRGTLTLDAVVADVPLLAERPGFAVARDGHWRSSFPLAPAIAAGATGFVLHHLGIVDLRVLYSANVVAKITASLLVTAAVLLAYVITRRYASQAMAVVIALTLGLGTGFWSTASQTLWQHETVLAGLTGATALLTSNWRSRRTAALLAGMLLGVAVAARFQVFPAILILCAWAVVARPRTAPLMLLPVVLTMLVVASANVAWFGHPLGGANAIEQVHAGVHATSSSLSRRPWEGLVGLLVSPSRGLFVYSPAVLVACLGLPAAWRLGRTSAPFICAVAAATQISAYALYSVWWGGHTFGPRYLLDVLPLLVPAAALGAAIVLQRTWMTMVAVLLVAWSVAVAATGAFCYPAERWNTIPVDVDTNHERLWDYRDAQIVRCWRTGFSPQNFDFVRADNWPRRH